MLAHRRRLRRVVGDTPFAAGNKGPTMRPFRSTTTRSQIAKALKSAAAALLCVTALYQPRFAYATHDGGGGFHGKGFHAGGFHIGALHAGGFHAGRFYGGFVGLHNGLNRVNEGHWYHGWHGGRALWLVADRPRPGLDVLFIPVVGVLFGLRLLRLCTAEHLVLLRRSGGLLPVCDPVQLWLGDGSRQLIPREQFSPGRLYSTG